MRWLSRCWGDGGSDGDDVGDRSICDGDDYNAAVHPMASGTVLHHQKLVQIVRSRDTKRRRQQRLGAARDDFAVELSYIIGAGQADNEHDL